MPDGLAPLTEEDERIILLWKLERAIWWLQVSWYAKRIAACTTFLGWHVSIRVLQHYGLWF